MAQPQQPPPVPLPEAPSARHLGDLARSQIRWSVYLETRPDGGAGAGPAAFRRGLPAAVHRLDLPRVDRAGNHRRGSTISARSSSGRFSRASARRLQERRRAAGPGARADVGPGDPSVARRISEACHVHARYPPPDPRLSPPAQRRPQAGHPQAGGGRSADFLRLQFTDILGINKNVEVPRSQFDKALDGEIMFDGSSIEGFTRIEESDMLLVPDLDTFRVLPIEEEGGRVARLLCDIYTPDHAALRRLSPPDPQAPDRPGPGPGLLDDGRLRGRVLPVREGRAAAAPTTATHDQGVVFRPDPARPGRGDPPPDRDRPRADGLRGRGGPPRGGAGPARGGLQYADALTTADNIATFRFVVRDVANRHGFLASFMPKPIQGQNGSGMHTHQRCSGGRRTPSADPEDRARALRRWPCPTSRGCCSTPAVSAPSPIR